MKHITPALTRIKVHIRHSEKRKFALDGERLHLVVGLLAHSLVDLVLERTLLARDEAPVTLRIDPRRDAFCFGALSLAFEIEVFVVLGKPNVWFSIST